MPPKTTVGSIFIKDVPWRRPKTKEGVIPMSSETEQELKQLEATMANRVPAVIVTREGLVALKQELEAALANLAEAQEHNDELEMELAESNATTVVVDTTDWTAGEDHPADRERGPGYAAGYREGYADGQGLT